MLLSAVSVLVVAQSSSEIPEGLMNNPVHSCFYIFLVTLITVYVTVRTEFCCVSYTFHAVSDSAYGREILTFALNYGRRHLYYCLLETNRKISFLNIARVWKVPWSV